VQIPGAQTELLQKVYGTDTIASPKFKLVHDSLCFLQLKRASTFAVPTVLPHVMLPGLVGFSQEDVDSALTKAAFKGHTNAVRLLIENGSNINHQVRKVSAVWLASCTYSRNLLAATLRCTVCMMSAGNCLGCSVREPSMLAFCRHPVAAPLC